MMAISRCAASLLLLTALVTWSPTPAVGRKAPPARSGGGSLDLNVNSDDLSAPVRSISINSAVLPQRVLRAAARQSGIHDRDPPADATSNLAAYINTWYRNNGYVFARVTARSPVRNGRLMIVVSEPLVSAEPVSLAFYTSANDPDEEGRAKEKVTAGANAAAAAAVTADGGAGGGAAGWWRRTRARAALRPRPPLLERAPPGVQVARLESALAKARRAGVGTAALRAAGERLRGSASAPACPTPASSSAPTRMASSSW